MDIKEFVKETLRQIVEGVREVQSEVEGKSQIAPLEDKHEKVEFDMAVTVDEEESSDKGGGLSVYYLKAGVGKQTSASTSTVHRIKFSVGVDFESKDEKVRREEKSREKIRNLQRQHGM